jgi:hypothetical protein
MSGGAAKRARRGEKAPAADAVLNALIAGDGKALHEAMYLLPQRLPNVASSGQSVLAPPLAQVGEKRSLEADCEAKLQKQKNEKSAEARAAFRAVERASHCEIAAHQLFSCDIAKIQSTLDVFERQLDDMDKDETVKAKEYDEIIEDMKSLATHYKTKAFGK